MKVNPLTTALQFVNQMVRGSDGSSSQREGGQNFYERQSKKDEKNQNQEPVSEEEVSQAIENFTKDEKAHQQGLQAQVEGSGPGLRVTLKDSQGTVIKQLTGEEFVKMRDSTSKTERPIGKILDQKV